MAFMGLGQLVFGCLSDRYGRRIILLCGMSLYLAGTLAAGLATSLEMLSAARCLQGLGAAASHILSRAMLRDMYFGVELAQKMAIATGIFSVGPLMAPLLGAALIEIGLPWRSVFVMMAIYAVGLLLAFRFVAETNSGLNRSATQPISILRNSNAVLSNKQSRTCLVVTAVSSVSIVLIISISPAVYKNTFNITGSLFAVYYAVHAIGIVVGQYANHKFIGRIGIIRTNILAAIVMIVSAFCISLLPTLGLATAWMVSLCLAVFSIGFLSIMANATSLLLQSHGSIVGFAAAFQGTITMLFGGVMASYLSTFIGGNIVYWGLAVAVGPCLVLLIFLRWSRKGLG